MLLKFDRRFRIYGTDFRVSDPSEWGLYEKVIVSLDLAKPRNSEDDGSDVDSSFGMMLAAGAWDVVVFDEAHRLSRDERGRSTLRFRLAQALRQKTDALVLLSGTPHQGDQGKFRNLLKLVRPDLSGAIDLIDSEPDIVQVVLRNRKIDAVDLDGAFSLRGFSSAAWKSATEPAFIALEAELQGYLRRGYGAGELLGGAEGRAVGFVMTIYRKLASSSVAALWIALQRRLERITTDTASFPAGNDTAAGDEAEDDADDDALADKGVGPSTTPYFRQASPDALRELISKARECMRSDQKGAALADLIRDLVVSQKKKGSHLHRVPRYASLSRGQNKGANGKAAGNDPWRPNRGREARGRGGV